jgi:hypothetical protein
MNTSKAVASKMSLFGRVVLGTALLVVVPGCKQRALNDRSSPDAIAATKGDRAHFLWPVVRSEGASISGVQVCWYEANQPLPAEADAKFRFPASAIRGFFLESKAIGGQGGSPPRFAPFEEFEQEAKRSGMLAQVKGAGTLGICAGGGLVGLPAAVLASRFGKGTRGGKATLVLASASGLLCAGAAIRELVSSPISDNKGVDLKVHRSLEQYLRSAFSEDYRIDFESHQALTKTIVKVTSTSKGAAGAATPAGTSAVQSQSDVCPLPADALVEVEAGMKSAYESSTL